ncbi:hypothetical protein [Arthrobacter sp. AL12]|uniref:hypothetical protein n=1 Tax=Arthrobacter sp. AL12 TaxID=3042241 RepID=UPI00249A317A|nr:hypothetical protein [Arthrobacter sp. AL12]MDI3211961.1 hypothetical protein [Arthrobacter sp. AL12]
MHKSRLDRPVLFVSELGLLTVGLVLAGIGFANFGGAFRSDRLAFLGAMVFLSAGVWCCAVSLMALLGRPRSAVARATWMAAGWVGAAYPLSLAFTFLGGAYMAAAPIVMAGLVLALISTGKNRTRSANLP